MIQDAIVAAVAPTDAAERVRLACPVCELESGKPDRRRALSVETNSGVYRCHRCGARGAVFEWGGNGPRVVDGPDSVDGAGPRLVGPPEGYYPLATQPAARSLAAAPARAYARTRVPEELWEQLGIGATLTGQPPVSGRVIVPVLAPNGVDWYGWVGRTWTPGAWLPYYTAPGMDRALIVWNGAALEKVTDEPLLVVEGVFDAIHLWPNAVAVLGKPSRAQMTMLSRCKRPVVWAMDGDTYDEEGVGEADKLFLSLRLARSEEGLHTGVVRLPPATDPDEIPAVELTRLAYASLEETRC